MDHRRMALEDSEWLQGFASGMAEQKVRAMLRALGMGMTPEAAVDIAGLPPESAQELEAAVRKLRDDFWRPVRSAGTSSS